MGGQWLLFLHQVVREGLSERVLYQQTDEWGKVGNQVSIWEEKSPGRSKKASVCGPGGVQGREAVEEDREEHYDGRILGRLWGGVFSRVQVS